MNLEHFLVKRRPSELAAFKQEISLPQATMIATMLEIDSEGHNRK